MTASAGLSPKSSGYVDVGELPGTSHEGVLDRVDWLSSMILGFLTEVGDV
jgi:hypothetical protein